TGYGEFVTAAAATPAGDPAAAGAGPTAGEGQVGTDRRGARSHPGRAGGSAEPRSARRRQIDVCQYGAERALAIGDLRCGRALSRDARFGGVVGIRPWGG